MPKPIAVITTTGNLAEAQSLARTLVERKLAACAQISQIESFYTWNGAVQNDQEFRIWFKTTSDRYVDVERAIVELHSYELPAVVAVEFDRAYPPFAEWIERETRGPSAGSPASS